MGGAVSESLIVSPSWPVMALFLARGWALTVRVGPDAVSRMVIIEARSPQRTQGSTEDYKPNDLGILRVPLWPLWLVVIWLFFPRKLPSPRGRTSSLLQLRPRSHATCPWKAH